ncbi:glutathionylspermidine synthase family protein [Bacillus sp. CHD6a]|uniref:glutathionylspermidine synthase family protein n=1 Tax=Bacillus sp. CHD6a TaxID=1643452 RepID=UPI0006CD2036|nr:glutathionylspermidine synthase family protein [Bacillus sp. CHD6a]KPB04526.1 glutathionylspermidine synthase [Bacillus sp. CHD6a]
MKEQAYQKARENFYAKFPDFWSNLYGQEYALYSLHEITEEEAAHIRKVTNRVGRIFCKMAKLLRGLEEETLLELGYPKETIPFLSIKELKAESVISRVDLVKTKDTYKVLEINSDTPTFIKELFQMNGEVCKEFNRTDPNAQEEEHLGRAVKNAIFESYQALGKKDFPNIVFTSHDENFEDKQTVLYLKDICKLPSQYVPLHKLKIMEGEALLDEEGRKIDVLYRQTFPVESLILDRDQETGANVGLQLLELVRLKKLAIVNPLSAFLLQSKAVQAIIWGLHEQNSDYFTQEEHEWISEYFLATYLEPTPFRTAGKKYVEKPTFGREGDSVKIYAHSGEKVEEDPNNSYVDYVQVYQEYIDLPKISFQTDHGEKEGHMMIGAFLVNEKASAFGYRLGKQIIDNLSYFMPVGFKHTKE